MPKTQALQRKFPGISDDAYVQAKMQMDQVWPKFKEPLTRDNWDQFHLSMAWESSKRSPDSQTKVGAFLTNVNHEPVSAGFNGFPRDVDDSLLPNKRPLKYQWMIHSEINAILNASRQGKPTEDTILYCTHRPCLNCTIFMWQAGCRQVVYDNSTSTVMSSDFETEVSLAQFDLLTGGRMIIRAIDFKK